MQYNLKHIIIPILLAVFTACDSNVDIDDGSGGGNTSLSDPTNEVAVNTAPVGQVLADDVLEIGQDVRTNIREYVDDMTGVSDGNTTGSNFLRQAQISALTEEFPITTGLSDCDGGGSRAVSGTVQVTLNEDRVSGSIVGTFTISYDNCIATVLLSSDDGTCASEPTISGSLPGSIDSDFYLSDYLDSENIIDTTLVAADSEVMDVSVSATASEQIYAIDYTLLSTSGATGFEGTVAYEGDVYDLSEIEDFIATLSSDVACP